jgi:hypothetical protein
VVEERTLATEAQRHRENEKTMAFVKTTLTDEITGKNSEFCFNTEFIVSMQPARNTTILQFTDGQKLIVDLPYEALTRFVEAKDRLG